MGLERKLRKNQEKKAYKNFTKLWREEKRAQLAADDERRLGRKPTFGMYVGMVKSVEARMNAQPQEVQDFVTDENIDLEWEEPDGI